MKQGWRARGYLVDLDGTLISDNKPLPGARRMLDAFGGQFALVSNDAEHTPAELARLLLQIGLPIDPGRIVLAGACTLDIIAQERRASRVMLLGSPALREYGRGLGLNMTMLEPDIVVIARDRAFNYDKLSFAANLVRDGAQLIVTNPDTTHPGRAGSVVPETGALLAAVLSCAGAVSYRIIGKPEPALFERALTRLGVSPSEAVMIGDNPHTDGAGAGRLGIRYLNVETMQRLVLSGD
ncbi:MULTISPECIES: HAD-IIA family hydrolase [unclassified Bradyrhizobium]|uniref:HAD-IIA family hydrolase n=1 Tax=unclassified Bradyrhizobium TaxID=2631580 RepID=UPI0003FC0EA2|nr:MULTISPECIES: HAD family hydrolase [unclassified Bradyrhizobium]MCP3464537.1 HAD hydrolase-like protein [Bradyrhizobium sp. CCGUVB23]